MDMSVLRFFAVVFIFGVATTAWCVLGGVTHLRTEMQDAKLSKQMESLWGPKVVTQSAPYWVRDPDGERTAAGAIPPAASTIAADLKHEHRCKGLLRYSTFAVDFSGRYSFPAGQQEKQPGFFIFHLPRDITRHENLRLAVDDKEVPIPAEQKLTGRLSVPLPRDAEHVVSVAFTTFGQDMWVYAPGETAQGSSDWPDDRAAPAGADMIELGDFSLTVTTNFRDIDYPEEEFAQSPRSSATPTDGGMKATWEYQGLVTRQPMGVGMPTRQSAGPIVTRMSLFAPVSLLFFFTVLFTVVVRRHIALHPMHYLFISAGFFAFHILLAYLAPVIDSIQGSFWICAAVSVFLVVSYMRLAAGVKFAVSYVALAQLIYLVGFSYAFFWKGYTGLTVVIGAIATLFVLMQATGRIDWFKVFRKPAPARVPEAAPVQPAPPTPPLPRPDGPPAR
jgi:hypothetical protein